MVLCQRPLTAALAPCLYQSPCLYPSMQDGYGLSQAVDDMLNTITNVSLILTADNGTNAFDGIDYAPVSKGIKESLSLTTTWSQRRGANADVVVNQTYQPTYPFKEMPVQQ